jgi:hypothetical protein|tara:strand:- start:361 stop:492 length:132 start_codon:yes stop_codon:yes gene_type:complete
MWIIKSEISDTFRFDGEEEAREIMELLSQEKIKATLRYVKRSD